MKPIDMRNFQGHKKAGVDYSMALRDMLKNLLIDQAMTIRQIAETTSRSHETVRRVFVKLHGTHLYIAGWERRAYIQTALLKWGCQPDAPKPPSMTVNERRQKYLATERGQTTMARARKEWRESDAGKAYLAIANERRRERYRIAKHAKAELAARDPLLAAIMG